MDKFLKNNKTNILLTNALLTLLSEKSFEEIKLNELCELALVHKTTFYNHFEDKYDLLYYVIKNTQKKVEMAIDNNENLIEYYISLSREYIKNIKQQPEFYKALLNSNQNGICMDIFYNLYIDDVSKKMNECYKAIPIPTNYIAKFYVNGVLSLVSEWFVTGMKESEEDLAKYIEILIKSEKK